MLKNSFLFLFLITFIHSGYSQTKTIKINTPHFKNTFETISVLISNDSILNGRYTRTVYGKLAVEGQYDHGIKTGIWKTYTIAGKTESEIDYDNNKVISLKKDSITNRDIIIESQIKPAGDRPLININGSNMVYLYLVNSLIYPEDAKRKNISGKVIVAIKVNAKGEITDYAIDTSVLESVDNEALRVIKLIPLEFLPAYKDGIPVDSVEKISVKFTLN